VLAIDASAPRSVVVVAELNDEGGRVLAADARVDGANQASATLDQRITELMERAGVTMTSLVGLGCGRGPGTFTGTRVAVATMQGIALATKLTVLPIGTLEAIAHSVEGLRVDATRPRLALLDARRGEVYGQAFVTDADGNLVASGEARCAVLENFEILEASPLALGPGVSPYADTLPADARPLPGPSVEGLLGALIEANRSRWALPPSELDAIYLRATYAELGIHKPKRAMYKSPFVD